MWGPQTQAQKPEEAGRSLSLQQINGPVVAPGLDPDTYCQQWASWSLGFLTHTGNKLHRRQSLHPS